mgnify:CR=1 FL=1
MRGQTKITYSLFFTDCKRQNFKNQKRQGKKVERKTTKQYEEIYGRTQNRPEQARPRKRKIANNAR